MKTLSIVTIGQAPRPDITPELATILPQVSFMENGALDQLSPEEIRALTPPPGATGILTSKLRDGTTAIFSHTVADPLVAQAIARGEAAGADATLVICSSHFPDLPHSKPLFFLEPLAHAAVRGLLTGYPEGRLGVLCPLPEQEALAHERWAPDTERGLSATASASPYTDTQETIAAAIATLSTTSDLVVLDCAGYSAAMAAAGQDAAPVKVPILPVRELGVRVLSALLS